MKERPILFSGEMVRAMLAGHKTQTRRALKTQPLDVVPFEGDEAGRKWVSLMQRDPNHGGVFKCRYGVPGDRLWVRETWRYHTDVDHKAIYRADGDDPTVAWRPSIFMPRWASRITLTITDVRVGRLQDISPDDCRAEGLKPDSEISLLWRENIKDKYRDLWNSINAKRGYGWDANPWVWVISFEVQP